MYQNNNIPTVPKIQAYSAKLAACLESLTLLKQLCSEGCTLGLPLQLEMLDRRGEGSHQRG